MHFIQLQYSAFLWDHIHITSMQTVYIATLPCRSWRNTCQHDLLISFASSSKPFKIFNNDICELCETTSKHRWTPTCHKRSITIYFIGQNIFILIINYYKYAGKAKRGNIFFWIHWCFTAQSTIFQSYCVTAHRCAGDWRMVGMVRLLNVPSEAQTLEHPLYVPPTGPLCRAVGSNLQPKDDSLDINWSIQILGKLGNR